RSPQPLCGDGLDVQNSELHKSRAIRNLLIDEEEAQRRSFRLLFQIRHDLSDAAVPRSRRVGPRCWQIAGSCNQTARTVAIDDKLLEDVSVSGKEANHEVLCLK